MEDIIYGVSDQFWDVAAAQYVATPDPNKRLVRLSRDGMPADEEYLVRTLKFYGLPLGQFASGQAKVSLEERITALEEELSQLREQLSTFSTNESTSIEPVREKISYAV